MSLHTPVFDNDNVAYFMEGGRVYATDSSGLNLWESAINGISSNVVLLDNGNMLIAASGNADTIWSLDKSTGGTSSILANNLNMGGSTVHLSGAVSNNIYLICENLPHFRKYTQSGTLLASTDGMSDAFSILSFEGDGSVYIAREQEILKYDNMFSNVWTYSGEDFSYFELEAAWLNLNITNVQTHFSHIKNTGTNITSVVQERFQEGNTVKAVKYSLYEITPSGDLVKRIILNTEIVEGTLIDKSRGVGVPSSFTNVPVDTFDSYTYYTGSGSPSGTATGALLRVDVFREKYTHVAVNEFAQKAVHCIVSKDLNSRISQLNAQHLNFVHAVENLTYVGLRDGPIVAYDYDGNELWATTHGANHQRAMTDVGPEDNLYVKDSNTLYKVNQSGNVVWSSNIGPASRMIQGGHQGVYVTYANDTIRKIDKVTGNSEWTVSVTAGSFTGTIQATDDLDGNVYFTASGEDNFFVKKYDITGSTELASIDLRSLYDYSPSTSTQMLVYDGTIYLAVSNPNVLVALDATTLAREWASPTIAAGTDGYIDVVPQGILINNTLIDRDNGEIIWGGTLASSPIDGSIRRNQDLNMRLGRIRVTSFVGEGVLEGN